MTNTSSEDVVSVTLASLSGIMRPRVDVRATNHLGDRRLGDSTVTFGLGGLGLVGVGPQPRLTLVITRGQG